MWIVEVKNVYDVEEMSDVWGIVKKFEDWKGVCVYLSSMGIDCEVDSEDWRAFEE